MGEGSDPGLHRLRQAVSVGLSFDLRAYDWSGFGPLGTGLDFSGDPTTEPNQHVQVDLLTASAGPFDTGAGLVLGSLLGTDKIVR